MRNDAVWAGSLRPVVSFYEDRAESQDGQDDWAQAREFHGTY